MFKQFFAIWGFILKVLKLISIAIIKSKSEQNQKMQISLSYWGSQPRKKTYTVIFGEMNI